MRTTINAALSGAVILVAGWTATAQTLAPKSAKERDALMAIQSAPDTDAKLKAIDDMLGNFADTAYKPVLLDMAVQLAQQKGDYPLTVSWAERDLEANPKSYIAMLAISMNTAANTKEFDLDKTEKLDKADKYAHEALETLKTATKPPLIPEDKWPEAQKALQSSAHAAIAMVAVDRKKYDDAIAEYKTAAELSPDPATSLRLGDTYVKAGKYDDAIATFDKVSAMPDIPPQYKQFAENAKKQAMAKKSAAGGGASSAPATPAIPAPATPAAPQSTPATK